MPSDGDDNDPKIETNDSCHQAAPSETLNSALELSQTNADSKVVMVSRMKYDTYAKIVELLEAKHPTIFDMILTNDLNLTTAEFKEIEADDGTSSVGDDSTVFTDPGKDMDMNTGKKLRGDEGLQQNNCTL